MKNLLKLIIVSTLCFYLPVIAKAHEAHTAHEDASLAISLAIDGTGQLWRASVQDGFLWIDSSQDLGAHFSAPVKVNPTAQKIAASGEARPKIVLAEQGHIYLTWTESLKAPFAGYIWFSRSIDGGKHFEKPYIVHQDRAETTHRFDALNVSNHGKITVFWVDKRDLIAAKAEKTPYSGAAIYYAESENQGNSFNPEQKLSDSSCECCRIATTNKPDGGVIALWRHVFAGSERDHMIAEIPVNLEVKKTDATKINPSPILNRASFGHWKIEGCPHQGAALATGGEGKDWWGYHMAYFDGNDAKPGLYYSRMDGVAWASSPPKKFGNHQHQAGHPALWSFGEKVWLVWREIDSKNHQIWGQFSDDGGRSWQSPKVLATSADKADYPQLISHHQQVYLAWNTKASGLLIKALEVAL